MCLMDVVIAYLYGESFGANTRSTLDLELSTKIEDSIAKMLTGYN